MIKNHGQTKVNEVQNPVFNAHLPSFGTGEAHQGSMTLFLGLMTQTCSLKFKARSHYRIKDMKHHEGN